MLPLCKCSQALRSHVAAHAGLDGSKALTDSLSLINLSHKGLLLDCIIFHSVPVSLIRFSVNTYSKRGMVKDEEVTGVTENILPKPYNVKRPSKVLGLWSALSAS